MPEEKEQLGASLGGLGIPNLSDAIERLKAHPEIISMAASVLGQSTEEAIPSKEAQIDPSIDETTERTDRSAGGDPISDAIPQLVGLLGPMLSGRGSDGEKKHTDGKGIGRSTALLLALKPYLSKSRCEAVDRLVELGRIGEILERFS